MYPDGFHVHNYPSGSRYEGGWKGGRKHGQGTYTYAGGGKYVGDFVDDKRHGMGCYTYPDGDVYEGEFRFGRREGRGKYKYSKGECYEGEWLADRMHGKGKYTYSTGKVYDGMWAEDRPHGDGKLLDGGNVYDMTYLHGTVKRQQPANDKSKSGGGGGVTDAFTWLQQAVSCQPVGCCSGERGGWSMESPDVQSDYRPKGTTL